MRGVGRMGLVCSRSSPSLLPRATNNVIPDSLKERRVLSTKSLNNSTKGCPRFDPNYSNRKKSPLFDSTVSNSDYRCSFPYRHLIMVTESITPVFLPFATKLLNSFVDNLKHIIVDHDVKHFVDRDVKHTRLSKLSCSSQIPSPPHLPPSTPTFPPMFLST